MEIYVVGRQRSNIVYLARTGEPFQLDEYYVIVDPRNQNPVCKITDTEEIVSTSTKSLSKDIYYSLKELGLTGFFTDVSTIYIASAVIEKELLTPIPPLCKARKAEFSDIKDILINTTSEKGLTIGVIRGTEMIYSELPDEYKNIAPLLEKNVINKQNAVPFIFDINKMNQFPHIGLFGGSGSGKTFGLNTFLEELIKKKIPTIVLDPHCEINFGKLRDDVPKELQYDYSKQSKIFYIGKDVGIDFTELEIDELCNIINFSGEMSQAMVATLREIYQPNDTLASLTNRFEKLLNLLEVAEKSKNPAKDIGNTNDYLFYRKYRTKVAGVATLTALLWRIKSIEGEGIFSNNIDPVEKALKQRKLVIIRGSSRHLNIFAGYIIKNFYKKRRRYIDSFEKGESAEKFPPFIVVMDEAHVFAPKMSNSPTKNILKVIAQEGRKYGVFEIMATQRPMLLDDTIIAQLSTKIIFRTTIGEDLDLIEKETDLSRNDIKRLPYLNSGNAFISSAILGKTLSIRFRANYTAPKITRHPFDELSDFDGDDELEKFLIEKLPITTLNIGDIITEASKKFNRIITLEDASNILDEMANKKIITKDNTSLGFYYSIK